MEISVPFILGVLAAAAAVYFWLNRARNAAHMADDMANMAQDVMGAARRFGFRRRANVHPVDSLDDANVAVAALAIGFLELGGLPRAEQLDALTISLQARLGQSHGQAKEALVLGRWLVGECGGPQPAIDRLARRLWRMKAMDAFEPLILVWKDVMAGGDGSWSPRQKEALEAIKRVFRVT